jgi:hypothetical protein
MIRDYEQGVIRYDATTFVCHGITKDAQAMQREAIDAPNGETQRNGTKIAWKKRGPLIGL